MGKAAAKVTEPRPAPAKQRGHLDVRLFGHLEVALGGVPFQLATPRKSLQVLAYLLLHRGAVSREYLAFLLYPDDEESSARAKLRATLSEVAKILPQPSDRYVTIDTDKAAWNPDADLWLDVEAFDTAARDQRLAEAIDLYRGDLLPEIYDEWLEAIRERYRNAYLRCLTERVSELRRGANLTLAIETARKVLAVDPWREDVVRRIIAMRYESGDRAGALREYAEFAQRLRSEMRAEPMAETAAVAERITRGEAPGEEGAGAERAAPADVSAILPFVGRRDEMERLLETWSRVARGRGACAFISGEAGIGKSRIALEFAHAVEDRGGRVLVGTTASPEAVPYESVVDALRSALPLVTSLKPSIALACAATLLPEIQARVALPTLPRLDADSERVRLFDSLFRCLADLATPRPLLLILEDLHWAQAASIELLQFILRRLSAVPIMIVVTYRDEETPRLHGLHRLRQEARASSGAQNLWLSRLSVNDVEELRTNVPDMRDRSAEALIAQSQGNPLFITQLVVEAGEGERAAAPASLQEVVARRIDRLSEHARTAGEIAACIGDRFSRDAVREVSAWDDSAVTDALDELLDRRIVREAGGRGILEYTFTHQLVHEAIVQTIPAKSAAVRRRRIARVLEELYPERVPELSASLAAHYESAGDVANAARCYLEAVRRSISIGALAEARAQLDRAIALKLELRARADLLLESVTIESRSGDRKSWDTALSELERVDAELADPAIHRSTLLRRMEFASSMGEPEMFDQAAAALRACLAEDDATSNAALHLAEAKMAYHLGRLGESCSAARAALDSSRAAGDEAGVIRALCALAQAESHRGHLSIAESLFDEAAQVARGADPVLELLALSTGWTITYQLRDLQRCRALATRSLELAIKLGDRTSEAQAHGRLGVTLDAAGGECSEARRHYAAAGRIYSESGNLAGTAAQLLNQALLEMRLGFFERALAATETSVELFVRANDERGHVGGLNNLVFLRACVGQIDGAREAAQTALDIARSQGFGLIEASITENLAFTEAAAGNYARAIELGNSSLELRSRSESQVWSSTPLANIAIWHAVVGNLPAAHDAIRRMLAGEDAIMRATDWPSYCYWVAAQIFHLDGKTGEAARALERARRLMQTTADQLEPEDREHYLALPWHLDLMQAVTNGVWLNPPR